MRGTGIAEDDIYIDFISQTKIYDFKGAGLEATQYLKGFEIKKNVIVKIRANSVFEQVVELASENGIYDIVKVDYINTNIEKIHADMMAAASEVIKNKKDMYVKISPVDLVPTPKLKTENFYSIYPNNRYKNYEAFETSEVTGNYNAGLVQKLQRKNKTFYYDKIDQSRFDLVINSTTPVVGIQYVLEVVMEYAIKKN